ncbi:MAG: transposase [Desulfobacteraceae bacterium]|nr:transposase [Desulfobacteraceae bacterium]
MFDYICEALKSFRGIFSRNTSWVLFCMVILGFIGANEMIGVTSFCRFWGVGNSLYMAFLNFFRASSWSLPAILAQWGAFVMTQEVAVLIQGRMVMIGDHTYVPKDGRRMPGVVSLHQNSETQSKPSYFRGHCWGAIALVAGSTAAPYCLPLALAIHLGMLHIGQVQESRTGKRTENMGTRVVQMAIDFALRHDAPSVLVLDAFFPTGALFRLAASVWCVSIQRPLVTLVIRAKKNCVAYFDPEPYTGRGRPRKYGEKVSLMELFDHSDFFSKATCHIYGRTEEILIASHELLWKPLGDKLLFVLAVTSRGPLVLMCSDLSQNPVAAVELYCLRPRIEVMFDMLKNLIGAFSYRFWSRVMPRHSRKPKKNKLLKPVPSRNLNTVRCCWEACERFVMLGSISLGLLILTALKHTDTVWEQFDGYLRTRSRSLPSERTVKYVIGPVILKNFLISAPIGIMREIRNRCFGRKTFL